MSILFGHPTGNPNSHHAALAHFETGRLEAICVPWMPAAMTVRLLGRLAPLRPMVERLARREFPPLADAPKVQGRMEEWGRLLRRGFGLGGEHLSRGANEWLMRTMRRECRRPAVTVLHSYEDCSLWQFREAKRVGKACLYDMPIGYYPAWERTKAELVQRYPEWLEAGGLPPTRYADPAQKREEMELADLVLSPSAFVERTIRSLHPYKKLARAPYGVDTNFWQSPPRDQDRGPLRFVCAGQLSLRKGIPLLIEAWEKANLVDCRLDLVGAWRLAKNKRKALPDGVTVWPPCSSEALRERYRAADVFVLPSFFEGMALVLLEAMACGLPAIASEATADPGLLDASCGKLVPIGDLDALVASLKWFASHPERLPELSRAARKAAERCTWDNYRRCLTEAVASFV